MCLDLMHETPASAACTIHDRSERNGGAAETVSIALSFPSGVPAQILLSNQKQKARHFRVRCASAELLYDDLSAHKLMANGSPIPVEGDLPLTVAVREFAAAIAAGNADRGSLDALMSNLTQRVFLMRNVHDDAPLLIDPKTGRAVDPGSLPLHLRKAKLTRTSLEANGSICRGMLRHRYDTPGQGEEEQ